MDGRYVQSRQGSAGATKKMEEPGKLRTCFVKLLESLLEGLHEVFPECVETENVLRLFRMLVTGDVARETECVRTCHELFRQHGDALKERDVVSPNTKS